MKFLKYSLALPLYLISYIIFRRHDLWIFSAWYGKKYSDNSRHLYQFVSKNSEKIEAVWITKCRLELVALKENEVNAVYCYSLLGMWLQLRAGTAICTHSISDEFIPWLINSRTRKVNLWHGVPLKKIGRDVYYRKEGFLKKIIKFVYPFNYDSYFIFASTSTKTNAIYAHSFSVEIDKIKNFGYPRNDVLFVNSNIFNTDIDTNMSRVLYAPTYRNDSSIVIFSKSDLISINKFCASSNITFDVKLHPADFARLNSEIFDYSNIRLLDQSLDLNEILSDYDLLVSDYSGCLIDFLLLDRPIVLYTFDYSNYRYNPGLYDHYDKFIKYGNVASDLDTLLHYLLKFSEGKLINNHIQLSEFFHDYKDAFSSRRYYDCLVNSLH